MQDNRAQPLLSQCQFLKINLDSTAVVEPFLEETIQAFPPAVIRAATEQKCSVYIGALIHPWPEHFCSGQSTVSSLSRGCTWWLSGERQQAAIQRLTQNTLTADLREWLDNPTGPPVACVARPPADH